MPSRVHWQTPTIHSLIGYKEHALPRDPAHPKYNGMYPGHRACEDFGFVSDNRDDESRTNPVTAAYAPNKASNGKTWGKMAQKKPGDQLCLKWPAKNHHLHVASNEEQTAYWGDKVGQNEVYVYLARTEQEPANDDEWRSECPTCPIKFQMPYINCPDPHPTGSDDFKPCGMKRLYYNRNLLTVVLFFSVYLFIIILFYYVFYPASFHSF